MIDTLNADTPTVVVKDRPKVWQLTETEFWLAPTLEDAIEASMKLSGMPRGEVYEPGRGTEPVTDDVLEAIQGVFFDDQGISRSGLEEYRERVRNGATVDPFVALE